jgi:DNA helicase-4
MNYRSIKSIVDTGAEIIKNNSGLKLEKETIPYNEEQKSIKIYLSNHEPKKKYVSRYYDHITEHCSDIINNLFENGYKSDDILLLTRIFNNPMLMERLEGLVDTNRIRFKSVHRSKGLQSKAVFILDVKKGLYGFPCELENSKLLEPAIEDKIHSKEEEERRLFYVAVTRAKEDVYIYSQVGCESKFINEIKPLPYVEIEELSY